MHLAAQPVNQRSVQHGPLVLVSEPRKFHTPTIDRDRTVSRRSEPSSRATLMGEQPNPWLGREHPDNQDYLKRIEVEGKLLDAILKRHSRERRETMLDYIAEHDTELLYLVERKEREGLDNFLKNMTEYVDLCMA